MSQQFSIADIETFCARFYTRTDGTVPRLTIAPYVYNKTFTNLSAAQSQTLILQMQANADFMCLGLQVRANIGAAQDVATITAPFLRALISDTGSNEQWMNEGIDLVNYGTVQAYENAFYYPRIVAGRSSLSITLTSYTPVDETYDVDLAFKGVRVQAFN